MKILIATKNPGKIEGAKLAFSKYYKDIEIQGIDVSSDVPDQPLNEQIYEGAKNRVKNLKQVAKQQKMEADYYIAIESGITNQVGEWLILNIAIIEDKQANTSIGTAAGFPVPEKYVEEIINTNLGQVMDRIFNDKDLNLGSGGINRLTHNEISRIDLTTSAFIMALTKFINEKKWR